MSKFKTIMTINVEIDDWLVLDDEIARRVTGVEVHSQRGDGLMDGEVRIHMGGISRIYNHQRLVKVFK